MPFLDDKVTVLPRLVSLYNTANILAQVAAQCFQYKMKYDYCSKTNHLSYREGFFLYFLFTA